MRGQWVEWTRTNLHPWEREDPLAALTIEQKAQLLEHDYVWLNESGAIWKAPDGALRRARFTHAPCGLREGAPGLRGLLGTGQPDGGSFGGCMRAASVSKPASAPPGRFSRWFRHGESLPCTNEPEFESELARIPPR